MKQQMGDPNSNPSPTHLHPLNGLLTRPIVTDITFSSHFFCLWVAKLPEVTEHGKRIKAMKEDRIGWCCCHWYYPLLASIHNPSCPVPPLPCPVLPDFAVQGLFLGLLMQEKACNGHISTYGTCGSALWYVTFCGWLGPNPLLQIVLLPRWWWWWLEGEPFQW